MKDKKLREEIEMRLTYALTSGENLEYAVDSMMCLLEEQEKEIKKELGEKVEKMIDKLVKEEAEEQSDLYMGQVKAIQDILKLIK